MAPPFTLCPEVRAERRGHLGVLTLNRAPALNALSLDMVRALGAWLRAWCDDPDVGAVLLRGAGRPGKAPAFCAGGDIRFFHQAALAGDPRVEDFFTEEYALDHQLHRYPKPTLVLMDGITMGGGMGLAQGCRLRIVTEHSRLAMPETQIGLFPDVGGGGFLARTPGRCGEYLGLSGAALGAADALAVGWADVFVRAARLDALTQAVADATQADGRGALEVARAFADEAGAEGAGGAEALHDGQAAGTLAAQRPLIDEIFALPTLADIVAALAARPQAFAAETAALLARRSPLLMAVTLEQVRRARSLGLADEFRMERGMMRQCFQLRPGACEALEGIRALAIDKDQAPRWQPTTVGEVDAALVQAFFDSPWPDALHPLRDLD